MKNILISLFVCAGLIVGCSASDSEQSKVDVQEGKVQESGLCIQLMHCLVGQEYCCLQSTCVHASCPPRKTWDRTTCTCL